MSKHPTSELSPRDIAAMDYGHQYMRVINAFKQRNFVSLRFRGFVRDEIKIARDYRERIFRTCDECAHEDAFDCNVRNERLCDCFGFKDYAPTCPHYEERRENE